MKCYSLNSSVKIKALFYNDCKEASNASSLSLVITKPDNTVVTINNGFTNVDVGYYYYEFSDSDIAGTYNYVWNVTIDGLATTKTGTFEIKSGGSISIEFPELKNNELVIIELLKDIKATDGTGFNNNQFLSFSTVYDPFYCSTDMLLMELGVWAESIPEDTLALAIHWSSIEAEYITSNKPTDSRYEYALTRFVMYDAALKLLRMPIGPNGGTGGRKELGDLLVESGSLDFPIKDLITELKLERDEWWRVLNAGGKIMPGQGLGPTFAVKGDARKEARKVSREWHDPWSEYYTQPSANSKYRRPGESKYKSGFTRWSEYYFTSVTKGIRR